MNFKIALLFSLSIFIVGIIGIIRFKKINAIYYPFLFSIWIGCVTELISLILAENNIRSYVNNNIYIFIESILITFLFKNLGLFKASKKVFYVLIISLILGWLVENIILGNITTFSVYFTIYSSFIIVLMSITIINRLLVKSRRKFFTNASFLLCIAFIIYFTFQVLVYSFWVYGVQSDSGFLLNIFSIMVYINLLTNLIYALAVLWMHKKQEFTLQF
jgi:hypothetical protein